MTKNQNSKRYDLEERALKFAKECIYWLKLTEIKTSESEGKRKVLIEEANQLLKIFSSIVEKSK
jgi:hypothetical protein